MTLRRLLLIACLLPTLLAAGCVTVETDFENDRTDDRTGDEGSTYTVNGVPCSGAGSSVVVDWHTDPLAMETLRVSFDVPENVTELRVEVRIGMPTAGSYTLDVSYHGESLVSGGAHAVRAVGLNANLLTDEVGEITAPAAGTYVMTWDTRGHVVARITVTADRC